jgi:hypothetical protein
VPFFGNRARPENGLFAAKESDCGFLAILRRTRGRLRNRLYDKKMTLLHCGGFDLRPFVIMVKYFTVSIGNALGACRGKVPIRCGKTDYTAFSIRERRPGGGTFRPPAS